MSEKLEFDLSVKNNQLSSSLEDAAKKSSSLQRALETTAGVIAGNLLTGAFNRLTDSIVDFGKGSIKAFSEQEDALQSLSQALRASGSFSKEAVDDFSEFASQLQKTSVFGDEVVLSQLAVAKSFGATNEKAKELVTAAANLSATFGGSLQENLTKLGKTLSGETGRLAQFIPELKSLTRAQLEAGEAAEIVNSKFSGAAASQLGTYSGSVIGAANAFSDLQEEIGAYLVKALDLEKKNESLNKIYGALATLVATSREESERANGTLDESAASVGRLKDQYALYATQLKIAEDQQKQLNNDPSFFERILGIPESAAKGVEELRAKVAGLQTEINNAEKSLKDSPKGETGGTVGGGPDLTKEQEVKNAEILALRRKLALESEAIDEQFANSRIANEFGRQEAELQRIQEFERQKAEIDAALKLQTAEINLSGADLEFEQKKIQLEKEIALKQSFAKLENDSAKVSSAERIALAKKETEEKVRLLQIQGNYIAAAANIASAIAKEGTTEAFLISKAAAVAAVAIQDAQARATATAAATAIDVATLGVGGPIYLAKQNALITSSTALALSGIAATALKGFESGGFVGGPNGATKGADNKLATIREGEMILNADQQRNLIGIINGGANPGGDIVIQINSREIARAVRDEVRGGFKL